MDILNKVELDLHVLSKPSSHTPSVLLFYGLWQPQSVQILSVMIRIQQDFPCFRYYRVCDGALDCAQYGIKIHPTVVAMSGAKEVDRVEGANPPALLTMIEELQLKNKSENLEDVEEKVEDAAQKKKRVFDRIANLLTAAPVLLFMKGTRMNPNCKFSRATIELAEKEKIKYTTFDILQDNEIRQGLKEYSDWPTFPQLYVNGELIGGYDIISDMVDRKTLRDILPTPELTSKSIEDRIKRLINGAPVMLFMKGTPESPRCGFSTQIVDILRMANVSFSSFDILNDEEIREAMKAYSDWPTYPQLYAHGEFVGGLDVVKSLVELGGIEGLMEELSLGE